MRITAIDQSTSSWTCTSSEEGIWFSNDTYLYIVYWEDNNWDVDRFTRDLVTITTTWVQTWTKPTSLIEVEWLTYN